MPLKLFTGTAGVSPADLTKSSTDDVMLALRGRGGRDARGPSEELET